MLSQPFSSIQHLDYLQRTNWKPTELPEDASAIKVVLRDLWHISGVGCVKKDLEHFLRQPEMDREKPIRLPGEDVLIGLYGCDLPVVFYVEGRQGSIAIYMGIWDYNESTTSAAKSKHEILPTTLKSLYPSIKLDSKEQRETGRYALSGLVLGIPTTKNPASLDGALPIDRLIRAMFGTNWACLILSQPWSMSKIRRLREICLEEMKQALAEFAEKPRPIPMAEHYVDLLRKNVNSLTDGLASGAWQTAAYIMGDEISYFRLVSVWRSIFSGDESITEPIQIWNNQDLSFHLPTGLSDLYGSYKFSDVTAPPGPGNFQHPFAYQTLLNSSQLAAYIHLPKFETSGFKVYIISDFDVMSSVVDDAKSVEIGKIVSRGYDTNNYYQINKNDITRHILIVGVTGSGKTNTLFHILRQLWKLSIPFLIIEPAKTEYRALLTDELIGSDLRVFTLGNELISPFRLNPFEFEKGVFLSTHIDLLKSVFNAAFSMWTVLPQVLEQSIHRVYQEYGWDVVRNENHRITSSSIYRAESFPILADLKETVRKLVDKLGYEPRTTSEIKAALLTRLQSLRIGGKGKMLDTRESFSFEKLLEKPTILELEEIGDDNEKAFLIGLILVKLYEHLRSRGLGDQNQIKHVVVFEEAHRLLANVPLYTPADEANTRGKAVETFVNMLSEVRAYGEGFLISEQIPSKLSPDVIKNTNVKIVHRTVAGDDRNLMSQAMNMKERHSDMLAILNVGEAVVFAEGDDLPIMVRVPKYEKVSREPQVKPTDTIELLKKHLPEQFPEITLDCVAGCKKYTGAAPLYCDQVQEIAETNEFQDVISHYVLSIVEMPQSIIDILPSVLEKARFYYSGLIESESLTQSMLIHSIDFYLRRMGQNYSWSFAGIVKLKDDLIPIVLESLQIVKLNEDQIKLAFDQNRLTKFRKLYWELCARNFDPFPACKDVCDQEPTPLCLYRYQIRNLLVNRRLHSDFLSAINTAENPEDMLAKLRDVSLSACLFCLANNAPQEDQMRIAICFAIHKMDSISNIRPELQKKMVNEFFQYLKR